jgi:cyclophilin family peptidyl-prolyl cis-trans isomerase
LVSILFTLLLIPGFSSCGGQQGSQTSPPGNTNTTRPVDPAPPLSTAPTRQQVATIETDVGRIRFNLLASESPRTAENFRLLAGRGFYDGLVFHRTINGFMIQGGDPKGDGTGGVTAAGQPLPNEINVRSPIYAGGYKRGAVAMANKGTPETATSQFFIMHKDYALPPSYTIFGQVIEGIEVVDKIASAPTNGDRPVTPVRMKKVTVE